MKKIILSAFVFTVLFVVSCDDSELTMFDCTSTPTYTTEVKAIIDASCATAGCHDAISQANSQDFSNYATLESESKKSAFIGSVQRIGEYTPMPLGGQKLSDANIETLSCWVEGGSPE